MNYYGNNDYRDYLAHHGILGMRWGKRNGPPYPLGASDHSASEKKAGWRKSLGSSGGSESSKRELKNRKRVEKAKAKEAAKKERDKVKKEKKISRIERSYGGDISRMTRNAEENAAVRKVNRERINDNYDRRINDLKDRIKIEKGRTEPNSKKIEKLQSNLKYTQYMKKQKLKDFDDGTDSIQKGFKVYNEVISQYKDAKISAVKDKAYKGSIAYRNASIAYTNQWISDYNYGRYATVLNYAQKDARAKQWNRATKSAGRR